MLLSTSNSIIGSSTWAYTIGVTPSGDGISGANVVVTFFFVVFLALSVSFFWVIGGLCLWPFLVIYLNEQGFFS